VQLRLNQIKPAFVFQKFIIPLLLLAAVAGTYGIHKLIRQVINPKKSFGFFILYLLLHFAIVFVMVFTVSYLIFRTGNSVFRK